MENRMSRRAALTRIARPATWNAWWKTTPQFQIKPNPP